MKSTLPIATVVLAILAVWYLAAALLNAPLQRDQFANAGRTDYSTQDLVAGSLNMERPKLPAPHQIVSELYKLVFATPPTSNAPRLSRMDHPSGNADRLPRRRCARGRARDHDRLRWLARTLDDAVDRRLADHSYHRARADDRGDPQPVQHHGNRAKGRNRGYSASITVGIVKGFRSPDPLHLDLMRTYSATHAQTFLKLRAPASAPFFFASMKVGAAAALVGAIVAEVTKSEDGGIGARLLAGSYYGQTVQIGRRCSWRCDVGRAGRPHRLRGAGGRTAHGFPEMIARRLAPLVPPIVFGAAVLALWEAVVRIRGVPQVSLPAPSASVDLASSPRCRPSVDLLQTMKSFISG